MSSKCQDLLKVKDITSLFTVLKNEFNTIVALMFQGGETGKTKISSWEYEKGSVLDTIVSNRNVYLKSELNMTNFSSFLFTYLLEAMDGKYSNLGNILSLDKPKNLLSLKFDWSPNEVVPYEENYTPPPISHQFSIKIEN